ncbi:MAG TPA: protein kinase [Myxococcota bacterium]|nr:protein kinase [Myxococcota bacterium]
MRTGLRILAFLLAIPLLLGGVSGALISRAGDKGAAEWRAQFKLQAAKGGAVGAAADIAASKLDSLRQEPVFAGLGGAGALLLLYAIVPRRKRGRSPTKTSKKAAKASKEAAQKAETQAAARKSPLAAEETHAAPSGKEGKKYLKEAAKIEEEKGAEPAGEYLLGHNMKDEAADLFLRHELYHRAAEVRFDQNRFDEAAELYKKMGKEEQAGKVYAQIGMNEEAAQCYLAAGKFSVAGELFERAENFREAGKCYSQIGFHRHAAQAYLKGGAEKEAAECLVQAFNEEGGVAGAKSDQKSKEMKGIAKKAAEILAKLERFEEAESLLVRSESFGPAAKIAFQTGNYKRASELFLRVRRGDLASKALERLGDEVGAARLMGEYLRDQGKDAEAVDFLVKAGEHGAAGDLYRKLANFGEAGRCYAAASDYPAAAEAFRAAGELEPAADAYAQCQKYAEAATCYGQVDKKDKQAEMLEKAGDAFESGKLYAELGEIDSAIRMLQQIAAEDARYGEACSILGRMFQEKGMHSLSIKKFEEAAGSDNVTRSNVDAFYELARAHERQNDLAGAIEIYERILSFDYHFRDVAACLERCKAARPKTPEETAPPQTAPGVIPSTQKRYEIVRELGRGGMGVVYLARDSVLEREVAYKVLPEGLRGNVNALKNFLREAKAAAQLNHPNIVTVYDAGESEHGLYMAMELVEGTTLKEILRQRGAVSANAAVYILRQMAAALQYAHGRKVVHRDIKTANTMWTTEKHVKIMDFGLAKLMEEVRNATTLISGTPFYMSPEQTLGRDVDHRTDLYSLGVTIFELTTGELPFQKGNVPYHHVHTAPPDPRSIKPEIPEGLSNLILRCLQKSPADRFQSAKEILDELDRQSGRAPAG